MVAVVEEALGVVPLGEVVQPELEEALVAVYLSEEHLEAHHPFLTAEGLEVQSPRAVHLPAAISVVVPEVKSTETAGMAADMHMEEPVVLLPDEGFHSDIGLFSGPSHSVLDIMDTASMDPHTIPADQEATCTKRQCGLRHGAIPHLVLLSQAPISSPDKTQTTRTLPQHLRQSTMRRLLIISSGISTRLMLCWMNS